MGASVLEEKKSDIMNFFQPTKDEKFLILAFSENPVKLLLDVKVALIKGKDTLNKYYTFYYEKSEKFREYINLLTTLKREELNEENLLYIVNTYFDAVEEVYNATKEEVDINWHSDENKPIKSKTKVAFYKSDVEELVRLCTAITMGLPLFFAVISENDRRRYFNINIVDLLLKKYKVYYNLIKLAYSRVRLDNIKDIFGVYNVLLSPNTAFLSNFMFILFNLIPLNKVLLPERYRDKNDKTVAKNFFAFFLSAISENNSFILKTYINNQSVDSIGLEYLLRKDVSTDLINTINNILTTSKISNSVPSILINRYKPTPISSMVVDICRVVFKVSENEVINNLLEYQYALYYILSKDEKLKRAVGHGIELLRLGTDGKKIGNNSKRQPSSTSEKIIANLLEKKNPFTKLLINKLSKVSSIKNYKLYYLDKEKETEFTNYALLNKMLTDFTKLYISVVIAEKQKVINHIRKLARILKLNTINIKEFKSFAEKMSL